MTWLKFSRFTFVFPRSVVKGLAACVSTPGRPPGVSYMFSPLFPSFPALSTGYKFFCTWYRLHIFPRLAPVASFPALCTGYKFFCAWRRLHIFPRIAPAAYFPALATGWIFGPFPCARLHMLLICSALGTDLLSYFHLLIQIFPFGHPNGTALALNLLQLFKKNHNRLAFSNRYRKSDGKTKY